MSSLWLLAAALLAVTAVARQHDGGGGDFAFDISDDLEVEIAAPFPAKREITALVGNVLHVAVPKDVFGNDVRAYEVRAMRSSSFLQLLVQSE